MCITMLSTLEVLYKVQANLSNPYKEFTFDEWSHCTCGHIYLGATGRFGNERKVLKPDTTKRKQAFYLQVAIEVAEALGYHDSAVRNMPIRLHAMGYISDLTYDQVDKTKRGSVTREHALAVIDQAIVKIEKKEHEARLKILNDLDFEPARIAESTNVEERDLIEV